MNSSDWAPWPCYSEEEVAAVAAVLRSGKVNYWTGEDGRAFEAEFARFCGAQHAIALANGTVALDLALRVLGIGPGDEVIVTPRTFVASASSIVLAGARPVFADVDETSQNVTPDTLRAVLTPATRAIVAVHLAGWPCDMDGIMQLAEERGLRVIEDCAQAHGAKYQGRSVGTIGHIGAWSFCQDKIITTGGEGGMVTTDDPELAERMWSYKDHGKSRTLMRDAAPRPGFRWVHGSFGTNWRLTEMQAAIGRIQLRRLPEWHARRTANAALLNERLGRVEGLRVASPPVGVEHAWYKYYAFVKPGTLIPGWDRDRIVAEVTASGVPCFSGTCPEVYLEASFQEADLGPAERLPVARTLGETSIMLPIHPTLGVAEIVRMADAIAAVMSRAVNRD